ncbi:MAG TPA: hypothetical protein VND68_06745 [Chloroflexia bacterium]|nr:hypothetical protein [Chloroflexia bacterium]
MGGNEKHTSPEAASAASDVLRDGRTSDASKSAAASALSQAGSAGDDKRTSDEVASTASEVMRDEDTGAKSKSAAASALSQKESEGK